MLTVIKHCINIVQPQPKITSLTKIQHWITVFWYLGILFDRCLQWQLSSYRTAHTSLGYFKGGNTPAQPLDVWSIWRVSDEVANKYVWCVQLRRKLSELRGRCLLRLNMRSLRRRAVGRLSHWILYCVCIGFLRTPFRHFPLSYFAVPAWD